MTSKNLVILAPWIFVTIVYIGAMLSGGIVFFGVILLFFFALIGSAAMASLVKEEPDK